MLKTKIIFLALAMSLLANCTTQAPNITGNTYTVTPESTRTPTIDIEPSETVTPTKPPSLTPSITWTPLPTLSADEANVKINELLETNGGCELPCWWGIRPNKTTWAEALHFLTPLITEIGQGGSGSFWEDGRKHFTTNFGVSFNIAGSSKPGYITFGVIDDIVSGITVFSPATEQKYQLHQLLALLGRPKQILLNSQSSAPQPELPPSVLTLDYGDLGIWASYGYIPAQVGENLSICPHSLGTREYIYENIGGRLELFDPKDLPKLSIEIEEYADRVGGFTARNLEDVTNMTVETFYHTFIDPKSKICLETPANLWP